MSPNKDSFEETRFMKELIHLRDTQEAIQSLSAWCIKNKKSAYKIARCWLKVVKKVKIEQKLSLFYLLNDVVQHSKRKNYNEVLERFQSVVKEAMPHLKDESIYSKVKRCIDIWAERGVFNEKYIGELTRILEAGRHSTAEVVDSFQPNQLCTQMKIMKALEDDTEYKLKTVSEADLEDILDEASVRQKLKDRQHGNDCIQEVEDGRKKLEDYIKAVDREISKRRQVKDLLEQAKKYYDSLYGEANIVATAYSSFGKKVKNVQKKLEAKMPELEEKGQSVASLLSEADLSPIPSPDYDAPSPEPNDQETELRLPDEVPLPPQPQPVANNHHNQPRQPVHHQRQQQPPKASQEDEQQSFSDYLTRLATEGDVHHQPPPANNYYYYPEIQNHQQQWHPDPPPAMNWPPPKPEDWPQQVPNDDPVPEWQIQTVDEEPPDEATLEDEITPNLALARLQNRNPHEQPPPHNNHDDMEVVNSEDEAEYHQPQQQLSLQDRLKSLAGIPPPPNEPPNLNQPPPRPFFAEGPPPQMNRGGPHNFRPPFRGRGGGGGGGGGNWNNGSPHRGRPFRGGGGGHRGGGGFRGGPRW